MEIILAIGYVPLIGYVILQAVQLDKLSKFIDEQQDTIKKLKPF